MSQNISIKKLSGRRNYSTFIDGRYVSTGESEQRAALKVAEHIHAVGAQAFRAGKRKLRDDLRSLIEEHLAQLRAMDNRDDEHIRKKRYQLMRPVEGGSFCRLRDVNKSAMNTWLDALGCSAKTKNEYLTAWNVFLDWLVYEDHLTVNPIKGRVRRRRGKKTEQTRRRAFTLDELRRLIGVSSKRSLLYHAAAGTGARLGELGQLRWDDVDETAPQPSIRLRDSTTKNGRERRQYLPPDLAERFAGARHDARTQRVFPTLPSRHTIERDLRRAEIEKETPEGRVSFHCLRHTYTTLIAKLSRDVRLAQAAADHANIQTTQRYLHAQEDELSEVASRFPSLRATRRATPLVQTCPIEGQGEETGAAPTNAESVDAEAVRPTKGQRVQVGPEVEPGGIEPPCRDSPRGASTRVVVALVSSRGAGDDTLPARPTPRRSHGRALRCDAHASSMSSAEALSSVTPRPRGIRPREQTAVRQLSSVERLIRGSFAATRNTTLSLPGRNRSAPDVKEVVGVHPQRA